MTKLTLALGASLFILVAASAQAPVEVHDFTLSEAEQMIEESKGSVVLFHLYASWCPPCRDEIPALIRVGERYKNHPFRVLAFSIDRNSTDLSKFLGAQKVNFEFRRLSTPLNAMNLPALRTHGINFQSSIPYTAIFEPSGKVVKQWTGAKSYASYTSVLDEVFLKLEPEITQLR